MKVALIYDRINKWGGAERVLVALHKMFPKAPLYTSVYYPQKASWANIFRVKTSFLQYVPFARKAHELFAAFMPMAFEQFVFDEYDLVISVTSEAAKGILTKPKTKHICICLTPTRYLWSGYDDYFVDPLFQFLSKPAVWYLRMWDTIAAKRPDIYIAISKEVQNRIKRYYNRESVVIYPPITIARGPATPFPPASAPANSLSTGAVRAVGSPSRSVTPRYFLVISRLVAYKRIDIAIQACNALSYPLTIVGTGSEEKLLKAIAGPTITFIKNLTDEELVEYYKNCQALIFPGEEDFGLTAVEAQSFGKPVIAYKKGGVLETVVEGKTGLFFYPQSAVALQNVLKTFKNRRFKENDCQKQASKFTLGRFKKDILNIVKAYV